MAEKSTAGPKVHAPDEGSLTRVGIIAFVGFVIGVAWPRLAGISLVPEAPVDSPSLTGDEDQSEESAPEENSEVIELLPEDRLAVGAPEITSCISSEGKKSTQCDTLDADTIVHPSLIALLGCPAAEGVFGTLSLGFSINFEEGKVMDPESGRSTDLPKSTTKELLLCAKKELAAITIPPMEHQFAQYQVYYSLEFKTPEVAAQGKTSVTPASGTATVRWGTAIVRKEGNRDAEVQTRLMSGARVIVTGRLGAWYRVKYDAKGREGWVIGKALGLD